MRKLLNILFLILLVFGLILIRYFESDLFYDPLLKFFKTDHSIASLPVMDHIQLYLNILLRYLLNSILSIAILWVLFKSIGLVKLSVLFYTAFLVVFMLAFIILINTSASGDYMALFYVRRFLIQPIFLLILLPAFYFQKRHG